MHVEPPRYVDGLPRPGRALVMGVLNVTPDSFSDGGRYLDPALAVKHGRAAGGRGCRPRRRGRGVRPVPARSGRRWTRSSTGCCPVVSALAGDGVLVSVDTMRAQVADEAVGAGAVLVNDVSGGLADERMLAHDRLASASPTC